MKARGDLIGSTHGNSRTDGGDPAGPKETREAKGGRIMQLGAFVRPDEPDEILTSREARELLKIGRTKLWQLTGKNVIPAYRLGQGKTSSLRYKRSELLAWLEGHKI